MDAYKKEVFYNQCDFSESKPSSLLQFCSVLKDRGLYPYSATIDGNPHLARAIKATWPDILIQRCLVHIQRQGLNWCRWSPKRTDAKHLRSLFLDVLNISNKLEQDKFMYKIEKWENRYGDKIATIPEKGKVFSDLKRARSMLLKALPNMFNYLENLNIPKTTNAVEGYFSRLKLRYRQHRGIGKSVRNNYFKWYINLCKC